MAKQRNLLAIALGLALLVASGPISPPQHRPPGPILAEANASARAYEVNDSSHADLDERPSAEYLASLPGADARSAALAPLPAGQAAEPVVGLCGADGTGSDGCGPSRAGDARELPEPGGLAALVEGLLADYTGDYGVAILNLQTGERFLLRGDEFFPSASLYKLAVLYEVLRQQQAGLLDSEATLTIRAADQPDNPDENEDGPPYAGDEISVDEALHLMITRSHNVAAYALARTVGWQQLNDTMASLGLDQTRLPVGSWKASHDDWRNEYASTSPSDMLFFFRQLYRGELLSPEASEHMLQLLLAQGINDRLPALLPDGTPVAHKTGNLEGIVNDAGIIFGRRADFILVVLSWHVDDDEATELEARLARALYDRFNGSGFS